MLQVIRDLFRLNVTLVIKCNSSFIFNYGFCLNSHQITYYDKRICAAFYLQKCI